MTNSATNPDEPLSWDDRPMYRRIADDLRSAITSGRLKPGDKLPSETELMTQYSVASGTVRQAVGVLRIEGAVVAEQGRGVFVRELPIPDRMAERLRKFTHWVVNTEPHIREMIEWLWTNSRFFAVLPAEKSGELVLCTDQAGWDTLREGFDRRPDVDLARGRDKGD